MKIGKYEIIPIETRTLYLDGGAMFGVIPKALWKRTNPADESNRIKLGARCLLLKSNNKNILIDTGVGQFWDEKFNKIYNINLEENTIEQALKNIGIAPDEISDVILTHLHFDHTGGSTTLENNKFVPTFSNAKYHLQKKHFEYALNPSERDKASFFKNRFKPLYDEGILNLINGNTKFDDEIELLELNGHTFSQQIVKISDNLKTVLYCGDLMPTSSHVPIPYEMGYDLQPLITIHEKREILPKAVEDEWILFFEHDPFTTAATVTKTDKGFAVKEKFTNLDNC